MPWPGVQKDADVTGAEYFKFLTKSSDGADHLFEFVDTLLDHRVELVVGRRLLALFGPVDFADSLLEKLTERS